MIQKSDQQTVTAADLVLLRLQQHGIQQAFGVVGGAIMYITDALRRCRGISTTFTHHEQAAAIAAEAYAKLTNKPALIFATAGPGVTNTITGVADAYMDSIPMIALLGDVRSTIAADFNKQRYNAPQEVNQYALMQSIVKDYTYLQPDMSENAIISAIDASVQVSTTGRPGPVCIVIPLDLQGMPCDVSALQIPIDTPLPIQCIQVEELREALRSLLQAKRPLVLLGSGVRLSGRVDSIESLISRFSLPWCVTIGAVDLQDNSDPLSCGCVGPTSQRAANMIFQAADCVLALATSFDQSVTGFNIADLIHNKTVYLVNIDPGESVRFDHPNIQPIEADIVDFCKAIESPTFFSHDHQPWLQQISQVKALLTSDVESEIRSTVSGGFLSAYDITEEISRHLPASATIVLGISLDAHTVFNSFRVIRGQRIIVSRNLGPMGWDVPGLLGASFAAINPHCMVLITGDGSLMLNVQELAVIAGLKIPACIFVFSNDGYASIRTTQSNFFGSDYIGCNVSSGLFIPPLEPLARGFGFQYDRLSSLSDIGPLLSDHAKRGLPRFVECFIDPGQLREPRLVSKVVDGKFRTPPLYDMTPPLKLEVSQEISRILKQEID
jgi:acetolactate synthase I/II/III large subunit